MAILNYTTTIDAFRLGKASTREEWAMTITDHAESITRSRGEAFVWQGNPVLCHDIATASGVNRRANGKATHRNHPFTIIKCVLDALDKDVRRKGESSRWEKTYIRAAAGNGMHGTREVLYRAFRLKEGSANVQ